MPRLGLAVQELAQLVAGQVDLPVTRQTATAAFQHIGRSVLLYTMGPASAAFAAVGRVAGIDAAGERLVCRIDNIRLLETPVVGLDHAVPGVRRLLLLSDQRFEEIVAKGVLPGAVTDFAAPYEPHPEGPTPETYVAIHDQVLRGWDFRCAITGERHPSAGRPHPVLDVVAIRPRAEGGPLHGRNFMPMIALARDAWNAGRITVTPDYDFVAVQNRLEPELLERMRRDGKLLLPADRHYWPDPTHLAYHRTVVFGR